MKRIFQFSILMLIAIMAMTSCKEDNDISVTGLNLVNMEDVVVIVIGNTYEMKVSVEPSDATEKGVIWTSSNSGVASVLGGVITANLPGVAEIVATTVDGAKSASIEVIVTNPTVGIVFGGDLKIAVGQKVFPKYGFMPPSVIDKNVRWSSSNENVAAVDAATGEITGVTFGTATITAVLLADNNITGSCKVEVLPIPVTGVTLTPKTLSLETGKTTTLVYATIPSNAENQDVTWSTSDANIAAVDQLTGLITGIAEGTATITVTTLEGGFTDNCLVTVSAAAELTEFVRVNDNLSDWSGDYLIVYEDAANANAAPTIFNGELPTGTGAGQLDATLNAIDVKITDGKIVADATINAAKFTITAVTGGYSIMSASGNYIGNSGTTNTIMAAPEFNPANHTNTIVLNDAGNVVITPVTAERALRYNSAAASRRFCFFAANGQQPVALYKLQ